MAINYGKYLKKNLMKNEKIKVSSKENKKHIK